EGTVRHGLPCPTQARSASEGHKPEALARDTSPKRQRGTTEPLAGASGLYRPRRSIAGKASGLQPAPAGARGFALTFGRAWGRTHRSQRVMPRDTDGFMPAAVSHAAPGPQLPAFSNEEN